MCRDTSDLNTQSTEHRNEGHTPTVHSHTCRLPKEAGDPFCPQLHNHYLGYIGVSMYVKWLVPNLATPLVYDLHLCLKTYSIANGTYVPSLHSCL